jgi:transposase-like protein
VAWGVTLEGRKVLLGLALGSRESYENWLAFGRHLTDRGLTAPALIVADGAPGLWKAAGELWPAAEEQRCTVHYADSWVMPTRAEESLQIASLSAWLSA